MTETAARERPELFRPRDGLVSWLESKTERPGAHLAIATGSWRVTATCKLECSGLSRFGLPLATADDAMARTDIMSVALQRLEIGGTVPAERITYIGDGPWDFSASQALGWSFIGIARDARADALREMGADRVHSDFRALTASAADRFAS
jgi:phosphoglycolate phosphatase-like HAD superfamily hydrolase